MEREEREGGRKKHMDVCVPAACTSVLYILLDGWIMGVPETDKSRERQEEGGECIAIRRDC